LYKRWAIEPLVGAIESLLARIPEACDASAKLQSDVQALTESLNEEREERKQEKKAKREQLDHLSSEVEDLKHKLVAAETLSAQIQQDLQAREQRYLEESSSVHKQLSDMGDVKILAGPWTKPNTLNTIKPIVLNLEEH
jgi:F0F1-type ATP synthase membrane subunit b/b'